MDLEVHAGYIQYLQVKCRITIQMNTRIILQSVECLLSLALTLVQLDDAVLYVIHRSQTSRLLGSYRERHKVTKTLFSQRQYSL
jgi:hypothetical protein